MDINEIEAAYKSVISGYDEPEEMWLTGSVAMDFMLQAGRDPVDAHGDPIHPLKGYYLSKETGLVPMR